MKKYCAWFMVLQNCFYINNLLVFEMLKFKSDLGDINQIVDKYNYYYENFPEIIFPDNDIYEIHMFGDLIVSLSYTSLVKIWNFQGRCIFTDTQKVNRIYCDNLAVLLLFSDHLKIWTLNQIKIIQLKELEITDICNDNILVTKSSDFIKLYDFNLNEIFYLKELIWSYLIKDNKIFLGMNNGDIQLWDISLCIPIKIFIFGKSPEYPYIIKIFDNLVVVGYSSGDIKIWNLDGHCLYSFKHPTEGYITHIDKLPNGKILSKNSGPNFMIWNLDLNSQIIISGRKSSSIILPDNNLLIWGDYGYNKIYDPDGFLLRNCKLNGIYRIKKSYLSSDSRKIIALGYTNKILIIK